MTGWDNQEKRVFSVEGVTPTLSGSDGGGGRTVCGYIYDTRDNGVDCTVTGFKAGNGAKANGIGYQEEVAPTLSAVNSGTNQVPAVAVFENHGQDTRFKGPVDVSQTVSATFGMGGNNTPLVMTTGQAGAEILKDLCPTLNCNHEQSIAAHSLRAKESCAYREDMETYPVTDGIVRRLTPLECERLQGYPDGWTVLPRIEDMSDAGYEFWKNVLLEKFERERGRKSCARKMEYWRYGILSPLKMRKRKAAGKTPISLISTRQKSKWRSGTIGYFAKIRTVRAIRHWEIQSPCRLGPGC